MSESRNRLRRSALPRLWAACLLTMLLLAAACGPGNSPAGAGPTSTPGASGGDLPSGQACTAGEDADCDSGEFGTGGTPGLDESLLSATPPALFPTATPGGDGEPGVQAPPDFTLPSVGGGSVELSGLLREGPVVVVFYRTFL